MGFVVVEELIVVDVLSLVVIEELILEELVLEVLVIEELVFEVIFVRLVVEEDFNELLGTVFTTLVDEVDFEELTAEDSEDVFVKLLEKVVTEVEDNGLDLDEVVASEMRDEANEEDVEDLDESKMLVELDDNVVIVEPSLVVVAGMLLV